jgi:hypothetical protein
MSSSVRVLSAAIVMLVLAVGAWSRFCFMGGSAQVHECCHSEQGQTVTLVCCQWTAALAAAVMVSTPLALPSEVTVAAPFVLPRNDYRAASLVHPPVAPSPPTVLRV